MQIFEMINSIYGKLDDLFLFCSVVEKGSLSSAAETLNLPTATLSRRISTLEKSLGMQLLLISKRCLVPTDAGKALYQKGLPFFSRRDFEPPDSHLVETNQYA